MSRPLVSDLMRTEWLMLGAVERKRRLDVGECACRHPEVEGVHDLFRCEAKTMDARTGTMGRQIIAERWVAPWS